MRGSSPTERHSVYSGLGSVLVSRPGTLFINELLTPDYSQGCEASTVDVITLVEGARKSAAPNPRCSISLEFRDTRAQKCCLPDFLKCIAYNISPAIINSRLCSLVRSVEQSAIFRPWRRGQVRENKEEIFR